MNRYFILFFMLIAGTVHAQTDRQQIILHLNGQSQSLHDYINSPQFQTSAYELSYKMADIDRDNIKELIIQVTSEQEQKTTLYYSTDSKNYKPADLKIPFSDFGPDASGNLIANVQSDIKGFRCQFCSLQEPQWQPVNRLYLNYRAGKVSPAVVDAAATAKIKSNLALLGNSRASAETIRNEYARQIVAYYVANQNNLSATEAVFNQYVNISDKQALWQQIVAALN